MPGTASCATCATALRTHPQVLPLLAAWTDEVHAVLADLGYEGERTELTTLVKIIAGRRLTANEVFSPAASLH